MKFNSSMFESIKDSLLKKTSTSSFQDFMKLEIGKTYVVRLLPNIQNNERTFYHYYNHMWNSLSTNQLVSVLCPTTYGERCPIDEHRFKVYRSGSETEKEQSKILRRNENWLVNVYVISDPTNPENEGKIKTLRYGKQLNKIIRDALDGDDAKDLGSKIFDLTENGCSFRIKVEKNEGGYATYVSSKFLPAGSIAGVSNNEQKIDEIYDSVKDLDSVFETKTYDEVRVLLDTHFFGKETTNHPKERATSHIVDEDIEVKAVSLNDNASTTSGSSDEDSESEEERKMREILAGL